MSRKRVFVIAVSGFVFILLCTGALFAGAARTSLQPPAAVPTTQPPTPEPEAVATRAVPAELPAASRIRTCSVSTLSSDERLGTFYGDVMDVDSGSVLFSRDGREAQPSASILKLVTATAAIAELGPDYRIPTTVVAGPEPGTIVLVGGGDPTLSRTPIGAQSVYPDAPKLADLAAQVKLSIGADTPITKIVLDSTYWDPSDDWDSSWDRSEQVNGYQSEVTALQVDGDRETPTKRVSPRSSDPVAAAGKYFGAALGIPGVGLQKGTATASARQLAKVESQPISSLINTMLVSSDGTLAESIARVTSKASGGDGSSASLQKTFSTALDSVDLELSDVTVRDGSGLSAENAVPPRFVNKLLRELRAGGQNLNYVYNGLSVAGESGGLKERFAGENAIAQGHVTGKIGHIGGQYSLAGIVDAEDGTELAFTFYATGSVKENAKAALDTLTTGLYSCGANLSNK